jgi:hypothetical protein
LNRRKSAQEKPMQQVKPEFAIVRRYDLAWHPGLTVEEAPHAIASPHFSSAPIAFASISAQPAP